MFSCVPRFGRIIAPGPGAEIEGRLDRGERMAIAAHAIAGDLRPAHAAPGPAQARAIRRLDARAHELRRQRRAGDARRPRACCRAGGTGRGGPWWRPHDRQGLAAVLALSLHDAAQRPRRTREVRIVDAGSAGSTRPEQREVEVDGLERLQAHGLVPTCVATLVHRSSRGAVLRLSGRGGRSAMRGTRERPRRWPSSSRETTRCPRTGFRRPSRVGARSRACRAGRAAATLASRPGGDEDVGAEVQFGFGEDLPTVRTFVTAGGRRRILRASRRLQPREAPDMGWRGAPRRGSPPRRRREAPPGRRMWRDDRTAGRGARGHCTSSIRIARAASGHDSQTDAGRVRT